MRNTHISSSLETLAFLSLPQPPLRLLLHLKFMFKETFNGAGKSQTERKRIEVKGRKKQNPVKFLGFASFKILSLSNP